MMSQEFGRIGIPELCGFRTDILDELNEYEVAVKKGTITPHTLEAYEGSLHHITDVRPLLVIPLYVAVIEGPHPFLLHPDLLSLAESRYGPVSTQPDAAVSGYTFGLKQSGNTRFVTFDKERPDRFVRLLLSKRFVLLGPTLLPL